MTDHTAGGESRARCDAAHTKAKGARVRPERDPEQAFAKFVSAMFGPPVLQPGTKVRLRVPLDEDDEGPFVVMGVITERGLHGTSVRYRIGSGCGKGFKVAPELVEAVPESPSFTEAQIREEEDRAMSAAVQVAPEARTPRYVEFEQLGLNLLESECGRFRVSHSGERWSAFDVWTGEASPASMDRGPALEWVATRAAARVPPLNWTDFADGARVQHTGTTFEVFRLHGPKWKGFDPRFPLAAFSCPPFGSLEQAKAWCAVRAMCEAQPLPAGKGVRPVLTV